MPSPPDGLGVSLRAIEAAKPSPDPMDDFHVLVNLARAMLLLSPQAVTRVEELLTPGRCLADLLEQAAYAEADVQDARDIVAAVEACHGALWQVRGRQCCRAARAPRDD